jgi:hypothetical protein
MDENARFLETEQLPEPFDDCTMLIDGFPVFGGQAQGGTNYSGKYRRAGWKFQMITTTSGIPIHLSPPHAAKKNDAVVFCETDLEHQNWESILGDKAYIGQPHCVVPPKSNQKITKENPEGVKNFTAWHRIHRSKVEHCFARLHRFRFMKYSYLKAKTPDAVRLITWGDHVTRLVKLSESRKRKTAKQDRCKCAYKKSK